MQLSPQIFSVGLDRMFPNQFFRYISLPQRHESRTMIVYLHKVF
jgi:hypothetical protein